MSNTMYDTLLCVVLLCVIAVILFIIIILSILEGKATITSESQKKSKHLYTDDECILSCYFVGSEGGYGGHECLIEMDECLEEDYRKILKEQGREGLWQYGIDQGFFSNYSPDYYGFFGKDYFEN